MDPAKKPEVEIIRGSPTPEEEAAIRAAILKIWRADVAATMAADPLTGWERAARAEAVGSRAPLSGAWRPSGPVDKPYLPARRCGVAGAR